VTENEIPGYTTTDTGIVYEGDNGTITFTNTLRTGKTNLIGEKVWEDNDDINGVRPEEITVLLLRDNAEYKRKQVSAPWSFEFDALELYTPDGRRVYEYTVDEVEVEGYSKKINKETNTIINTRNESNEGKLTVYKILLDVDGNVIDEDHEDYELRRESSFSLKLTDKTDNDKGVTTTVKSVLINDSVVFNVNDIYNVYTKDIIAIEEIDIDEAYELVEILPIYWEGKTGVTTVFNRVLGRPNIDDNELRVVKYVVRNGERVKGDTVNDEEFGITLTSVDTDATGTIIIDLNAVVEANAGFFGGLIDGFDIANISAILSEGDPDSDLPGLTGDDGEIVFAGLALETPYFLRVMVELPYEVIEVSEWVVFTDKITCLISLDFEVLEGEPILYYPVIGYEPDPEKPIYDDTEPEYLGDDENGDPIYSEPELLGYEDDLSKPIYGEPEANGYEEVIECLITADYRDDISVFSATGKVKPNDQAGLLFSDLRSGRYTVKETDIPKDFSFYGMKLGNASDEMLHDEVLDVEVPMDEAGALVVVFNEYERSFRLIVKYYAAGNIQGDLTKYFRGYVTGDSVLIQGLIDGIDITPGAITVDGYVYTYSSGDRGITVTFVDGDIIVNLYYTRSSQWDDDADNDTDSDSDTDSDTDTPTVTIPDAPTPLAPRPDPLPAPIVIPDEDVPLSDLPKTNSSGINGLGLISAGLAGLIGSTIRRKRRNEGEQG
jgi:LPXTG-motif cell wall-anchored protein